METFTHSQRHPVTSVLLLADMLEHAFELVVRQDSAAGVALGGSLPHPLNRMGQPSRLDWLEQIVHGVDLERLDGVLVEGRDEDHAGLDLAEQELAGDLEASAPRHVYVEENQVGLLLPDDLHGVDAVAGLADDVDVVELLKEEAEFVASWPLVIDHDCANHHDTNDRNGPLRRDLVRNIDPRNRDAGARSFAPRALDRQVVVLAVNDPQALVDIA